MPPKGKQQEYLTKATAKAFFTAMETAAKENDVEKAVENSLNTLLRVYLERRFLASKVENTYPHSTDGLITVHPPRGSLFDAMSTVGKMIADAPTATTRITPGEYFAVQGVSGFTRTPESPSEGLGAHPVPGVYSGAESAGESPTEDSGNISGEFSILIEAKKQLKFSGSRGAHDRAKVAAQVLYYLKRFEAAGEQLPGATIVGDVDELFIIPTKVLMPYLEKPYDWSIAPSSAAEKNLELFLTLKNDSNMNLYVEKISRDTLDLSTFLDRLTGLAIQREGMRKIRVTSHSLEKAFLEYQRVAFGGQAVNPKTQMSIFVKSLLGDKNIYLHPVQRNVIVTEYLDYKGNEKVTKYPTPGSDVVFDSSAHELFFEKYDRSGYSLDEQKAITEIGDTLIEELDRRFTGDYWTPKIWVDEAHSMIEEQLGDDWREKYVVWDPAAGSKNLTRDYAFKELYSSTLHQEELAIAEDYNTEGTAFQYDFLNDDIALHDEAQGLFAKKPSEMDDTEKKVFLEEQRGKWKLPDSLIEALVYNKPIVFLGNPPYGSSGNISSVNAKV